jgi:hypothetical protein
MVKSGQACAEAFVCLLNGAPTAPTVGPAGTLYVNGVANGAAVTITGANPYKWAVTLPALTAGDLVSMYITATIDGTSRSAFVWQESADTKRVSDLVDAAAAPTAQAIEDEVLNALTSAHQTTGSVGKAISDAGAAGDPWAATTRTLTSTAAATAAAVSGSVLAITRYATYDATISSLTIQSTWTAVKFTIKRDPSDADSAAWLQMIVSNPAAASTDGVLYVNGVAATVAQRTQGSLTVSQSGGTCAIHLSDDLTAALEEMADYGYDMKQYYTDGTETKSTVLTRSTVSCTATETAALA